ncbi:hypothetical protein [Salegentibacter sp. 24]|uniref:hypothetical protein n=1 Tax=Salegentibacter sp. 24 TaxID=2183986 RepID=UPI00105E2A38|nr:hypothetical protein [Salegentibacter sp. 24]
MNSSTHSEESLITTAYICKGKYSKKYHYKEDCRGLSNCSTSIYKTTVADAKESGRGLCGFED